MPDYQLFDLKISTLTPLHVGNGRTLLNEYDYAINKGKTWRINENALLDAQDVDDPAMAARLASIKPAQLLKPNDYREDSEFFRYVLRGTPRSSAEGAVLREEFKNTRDQPYIPGSSLKGGLRTSLAWYAWEQKGLQPDVRRLDRRREWAAKNYEADLFGPTPNQSLLRALHVQDSEPVEAERMMILNVRVLNRVGGLASPIEVEAIRSDTTFTAAIKLDLALFSDWAKKHKLNLSGEAWLKNLAAIANAHSRQRIQDELAWYGQIPAAKNLASFYQQLQNSNPGSQAFLLQLGWGTGWDGKTFGSRLRADRDFMEAIVRPPGPNQTGYGLARGRRNPGDPFPKSRRVAVRFAKAPDGRVVEAPAYPLGWALVEIYQER